jgi:hypothetical protein
MSSARELRAVWAIVVATAVAAVVTYARLPAAELYNVSGSGLRGGLGRALVEVNFPDALIALGVLGVVAPFLPRVMRRLAAVAALLCLVVVLPGVVSQDDLDAKWINVVPALGVGLAFVLTSFARVPPPRRRDGDRLRVVTIVVLTLVSVPWIAAALGFYFARRSVFQTAQIVSYHGDKLHHAVHHGLHHGLFGLMLVVTALLLSRIPNRVGLFLALMLAYGLGNIANDAWLEQIAEHGWTSWTIPSCTEPGLTWTWLAVLLATPVIWVAWFRQDRIARAWRPASRA